MTADFGTRRFVQRRQPVRTKQITGTPIAVLLMAGVLGLCGGCDALESLKEKDNSTGSQPEPVAHQMGQVTQTDQTLRTDYIKEMLIDPPQGEWPEPLPVLEWRSSLEEGRQAAREDGRPLFVLIRCPDLTEADPLVQRLHSPSPAFSDLLRQFVTVELTDGRDIDLQRMPFARYQDPDLTCWCWVLSPRGQVYSVLGQETPDAPPVTETEASEWLSRVLDHHWDPRREKWNADGPVISQDLAARSIVQSPGYDRWRKGAEYLGTLRNNGECMCCHQVQDILWVEEDLNREFHVTEDFWLWPPPANSGLEFAGEALPKVSLLTPGSFAARANTQPEAVFGIVNERRIFSTSDARAAINSIEGPQSLRVYGALNGQVVSSTLGITDGARRTYDLTWRTSIANSVLAGHPGFLPAPVSANLRNELRLQNRLALTPEVAEGTPAWDSGVRPDQVIIKLGEIGDDLTPEQFLFVFKLNNQVSSLAQLTVRRGDANWQPAVLEIPSISVLEIPPELLKPKAD